METVLFEPSILNQVFKYLAVKVNDLCEEERVCCLTLDEMSITPSIEYNASSGQLLGKVTLPGHCGSASAHSCSCVYVGRTVITVERQHTISQETPLMEL